MHMNSHIEYPVEWDIYIIYGILLKTIQRLVSFGLPGTNPNLSLSKILWFFAFCCYFKFGETFSCFLCLGLWGCGEGEDNKMGWGYIFISTWIVKIKNVEKHERFFFLSWRWFCELANNKLDARVPKCPITSVLLFLFEDLIIVG